MAKESPRPRKRISVELDAETIRILKAVGFKRDAPMATVAADTIKEALDKLRKEAGPLLK